ncbi:MAG TPA: YetF domain-containing protein [Solirubrobacteraceae bacterium]|nr:YetF domain-containing protein [Solirubrobacteraceae bacterium]
MDAVLRATAIYAALLVILRLSGKRTIGQITVFDFILLLVVAEATQQALLGDDFSVTNGVLVILTLVGIERLADLVSIRSTGMKRLLDGRPTIIVDHGRTLDERLERLRITPDEILQQARSSQGVERIEQIKYAVLERNGVISIVPRKE